MNVDFPTTYRSLLQGELTNRKSKNHSYSLRAFARDLGVSPTALSDVLSSKRKLSRKNALRVADRLCLPPELARRLLDDRLEGFLNEARLNGFLRIEDDTFRLMSDWYYFAMLNLAKLKDCTANEKQLGRRLGISTVEARETLQRLQRMGLVDIIDGKLRRTCKPILTTTDIPSAALRKLQKQHLELASDAIDRIPVDLRETCSVTMAADPKRLKNAKKRILKFKMDLSDYLEGGNPSEVYVLALQLFPIANHETKQ